MEKRGLGRPVPLWVILVPLAFFVVGQVSSAVRNARLQELVRVQQELITAIARSQSAAAASSPAFGELFASARIAPVLGNAGLPTGLRFSEITSGGLAAQLQLRDGDVLVAVNGVGFDHPDRLSVALDAVVESREGSLEVVDAQGERRVIRIPPE